jgi:hypothetical protein
VQKIGYRQSKRLAAERFRRRHVDRLGCWMGIDGLGEGRCCAHLRASIPLRCARHIAFETRDPRDDDLGAIGLVHAVADPTAQCHAHGPEKRKRAVEGRFLLSAIRSPVSRHPSFWLASGWPMGGKQVRTRESLHGPRVWERSPFGVVRRGERRRKRRRREGKPAREAGSSVHMNTIGGTWQRCRLIHRSPHPFTAASRFDG